MQEKIALVAWTTVFLGIFTTATAMVPEGSGNKGDQVIQQAIESAGGEESWKRSQTLVVHEIQTRYSPQGSSEVRLVHYLDTDENKYRVELEDQEGRKVFGWNGERFWATVNGQGSDANLLQQARRTISNGYYRFSLPFVLDDPGAEVEYVGSDKVEEVETEVVKVSYQHGPTSQYWEEETEQDQRHSLSESGAGQGGSEHVEAHHHSGSETYYYHFDKNNHKIVKIYFSHHGDDSFETLYFRDHRRIGAINKEHSRELIGPDGERLYDSLFTKIEFQEERMKEFYEAP